MEKIFKPCSAHYVEPPHPQISMFQRVLGVWFFSSIGANAFQVTLTLNFGGEGVVPDRSGLNISSIYGSTEKEYGKSEGAKIPCIEFIEQFQDLRALP